MTIVRTPFRVDSATAKDGIGQFSVVVRSVDDPSEGLLRARIRVWRSGVDSIKYGRRETSADTLGSARIDSVPAGSWRVEGFQVGYTRHSVIVHAIAGCHTVVELYLAYSITCLINCPTTPPRAVVTTCAPDV